MARDRRPEIERNRAGEWCAVVGRRSFGCEPVGVARLLHRLDVGRDATPAEAEAAARRYLEEIKTREDRNEAGLWDQEMDVPEL